ncbi:MAG TPA: hypothetical protein VNS08_17205 [Ureibacillus sp.]|nr:hypothetical protein [Ureibacillus sp.]
MANLYDAFDAFEPIRRQQEMINKIINPPIMQAIRNQQNLINQVTIPSFDNFGHLNSILSKVARIPKIEGLNTYNTGISKVIRDFNKWNNHSPLVEHMARLNNLHSSLVTNYPEVQEIMFNNIVSSTNLYNLFDDVTFDSLNVLDEIITDISDEDEPYYQEGNSDLQATITVNRPDLVSNMTKAELRVEMAQAIEEAQSRVSKSMTVKERIQFFVFGVIASMGQDISKEIIWPFLEVLFSLMIAIASGNHDYNVFKEISEKINETETAKTVKKAFVKDPEIEKPIQEMAFLRTESKLRTRPSNKAHLASEVPISKNTVVFPVEKKGNWILVEVETKDDVFIGWVQESRVIKFKLDKAAEQK